MGTANRRWLEKIGHGAGVFYSVEDSQKILEGADYREFLPSLNPAPAFHVVKFGGDWGGLWGTPERWGQLAQEKDTIIPLIYCLPSQVAKYRDIVGGLFHDGYKAVFLDCEMSFANRAIDMSRLLASMNVADNLVVVTSYAWFQGWPDRGQ